MQTLTMNKEPLFKTIDIEAMQTYRETETQQQTVQHTQRDSIKGVKSSVKKMQSPYNSKTIKNKFAGTKGRGQSGKRGADCTRCSELIEILKSTRFLTRE